MPNIPYKDLEGYEPKAVLDAVMARRGAGGLMNLDLMLLHSPPLTEGWTAYLGRIRTQLRLAAKLRELAICTVAVATGATYEFHHHAPEWVKAGATPEQMTALEQRAFDAGAFDAAERAVIQLALEMTLQVRVGPETLAAARRAAGGDQELVELIAVIAAYNMVARILVATGVEIEER